MSEQAPAATKRQIIAIGGGGFGNDSKDTLLERYVLGQSGARRPAVCFLPTASGDADNYIVRFYDAFGRLGATPSHLSLFRLPQADLAGYLLDRDVIYVGGGNTRSMMALWREWGIIDILRRALARGTVLAGVSAGAICWFEQGITDSVPGEMRIVRGAGLLPGSCCPHYDNQEARRPAYQRMVREGLIGPGYGISDGAALHFVNGRLYRVVGTSIDARAYEVSAAAGGEVVETPLETLAVVPDAGLDPNGRDR